MTLTEKVAAALHDDHVAQFDVIRAAEIAVAIVLEEAAKVADDLRRRHQFGSGEDTVYSFTCRDVATAIRALGDKP